MVYAVMKSQVNELDIQMGEQLTELSDKCNELAYHDSENLSGLKLYQDYTDIITSPKRTQHNHEILNFSPDAMLKYLSSMGMEEYRRLAIFLQMISFKSIMCTFCQQNQTDENSVASTDLSAVIKDFVAVKSRTAQFNVSDRCRVL